MSSTCFSVGSRESVAAKFHHHGSLKALWEGEWKMQCTRGVYPFNDGSKYEDFEPIIKSLIQKDINDAFDERWPQEFVLAINTLQSEASSLTQTQPLQASRLYLRAAALCHIARFPVLCSPLRRELWNIQKECYIAGASFWKDPCMSVMVLHKYAIPGEGDTVPVFCRIPLDQAKEGTVPVMLLICGLDGYRADMPARCTNFFNASGWAIVSAEIPGTGDCPADRMDPQSPDRVWSSVLDWIAQHPLLDEGRVCVWGFSTGGYYALRVAHTHAERVRGVVAQGAYAHLAFSPEWIDQMDMGEYPSILTKSLLHKYGYPSLSAMKEDAQTRFSLITNKIVDLPCAKTLMLNGVDDSIYPIEDSYLMLQYGGLNKEARFFPGLKHMAEPLASPVAFEWLKARMAPALTNPPQMTTILPHSTNANKSKPPTSKPKTLHLPSLAFQPSFLASPPLSSSSSSVSSISDSGCSVGDDDDEFMNRAVATQEEVVRREGGREVDHEQELKIMYWDQVKEEVCFEPGWGREEICWCGSMG